MQYWKGPKRTVAMEQSKPFQQPIDAIITLLLHYEQSLPPINKSGPAKKTSLEQEFLLTLMRLKLGLLTYDLAFRFQISKPGVSQIWITWVKFLSKELRYLISWPSSGQIYATRSIQKIILKSKGDY